MPEITLVNIAIYDDPTFAHIARSRLESEGIRAALDGEHHVAMDWMITNAIGGVKLMVRCTDRDAAIRILNRKFEEFPRIEIGDSSECEPAIVCPECRSTKTYWDRLNRRWIFLSLLLFGIPIPFLSNYMICESCKHQWRRKMLTPL